MSTTGADDFATRSDLKDLRAEMHDMRGELRGDMRELRAELLELRKDQRDSTRTLFVTVIASQMTLVGMVLAAVKIG
jgi:hypothetical protein